MSEVVDLNQVRQCFARDLRSKMIDLDLVRHYLHRLGGFGSGSCLVMSPVRLACSLCPLTATSEGCYGLVVCGSSADEASPASSSGCRRPDLAGPFLFFFRADEGCRSARLTIKLFVVSTWSFARGLFSVPHSCICQELKSVMRSCRVPPPVDVVLQSRPKASVRT